MAIRYKKVNDSEGVYTCLRCWDDANANVPTLLIPLDEHNTDYIHWKEWDAIDGNTTEDAD